MIQAPPEAMPNIFESIFILFKGSNQIYFIYYHGRTSDSLLQCREERNSSSTIDRKGCYQCFGKEKHRGNLCKGEPFHHHDAPSPAIAKPSFEHAPRHIHQTLRQLTTDRSQN